MILSSGSPANAQEVVSKLDNAGLVTINEELRQSASGLKTLRGQVADLLPLDLSDSSKVTSVLGLANGGTGQSSASASINALLPSQTGNSGKFLTTNGSAASWGSAGVAYAAGTLVEVNNATERNTASTTYVSVKSMSPISRAGTLRIVYSTRSATGNPWPGYSRIYINGVAVGTEHIETTNTYQTYSQDLSVASGDVIAIYAHGSVGDAQYVKDFKLLCTVPTVVAGTD